MLALTLAYPALHATPSSRPASLEVNAPERDRPQRLWAMSRCRPTTIRSGSALGWMARPPSPRCMQRLGT
jgi:hypothetical protein